MRHALLHDVSNMQPKEMCPRPESHTQNDTGVQVLSKPLVLLCIDTRRSMKTRETREPKMKSIMKNARPHTRSAYEKRIVTSRIAIVDATEPRELTQALALPLELVLLHEAIRAGLSEIP